MALDPLVAALLASPPPPPKRPRPRSVQFVSVHAPSSQSSSRPLQPARPAPQRASPRAADDREPRRLARGEQQGGDKDGWISACMPGSPDRSGGGNGDGDGGREERQGDGERCAAALAAGDEADYSDDLILGLLPAPQASGIFEVLFPDGDTMGVMVDVGADSASFMLAPGTQGLRNLLRRRQMELEQGLARRMSKYVRLTVL